VPEPITLLKVQARKTGQKLPSSQTEAVWAMTGR